MLVSIIICTYKRVESMRAVLACLSSQTFRRFEVLVVDGSGDQSPARLALSEIVAGMQDSMSIELLASRKGLTVQRNLGLDTARGELILFLDDDVTFDNHFLESATALLERPDMDNVGGLSGYDIRNFPQPVSLRWRLRSALRIIPALEPGNIDRLGRSIPVSFMQPFSGCKPMGYLYGFCMLYRAAAIDGLRFDENLPTYGGEDRDFSSRIAKRWRLMLCGSLNLEHHCTQQSRDSGVQRTFQAGFGIGRSFGKNASRILDYLELARLILCEFALDAIACLRAPSREAFLMPFARTGGFVAGLWSFFRHAGEIA